MQRECYMKISDDTRIGLLEYLANGINLHYEIGNKNKKHGISYLMQYRILKLTHESFYRQLKAYGGELLQGNLNKTIHYTLNNITSDAEFIITEKESKLSSLRKNNIEPEFCPVNALCKHPDEKELMKLCVLYNDLIDYVRNKDAKDSDNSIATDNYLFERTMQKALMGETGGVELSKRNGVGQALYADAIVKKAEVGITYIFDAKFYDSNIVTDKKGLAYKAQHNRFQICSYLEQYCASEKVPQNAVRGILVHAVDDEKYEKWKVLENGRIDVGRYTIGIKFIHIDRSADAIINQFRSLIS